MHSNAFLLQATYHFFHIPFENAKEHEFISAELCIA